MAANVRSWLLKKRTWLGVAVAAGVLVGMNLPDFWKGFGGGGGPNPLGLGPPAGNRPAPSDTDAKEPAVSTVTHTRESEGARSSGLSPAIKVVIAERSLWLRSGDEERPIEVAEVVELVKRSAGDADGIRLRIYRKPSSRPSAESALQSALADAGIPENAILWAPTASD